MAVKASAQITLMYVIDVKAYYRFYLLQSSTSATPSKPTTYPPSSSWGNVEPTYSEESTDSLFFVDCTIFNDDTFVYSEVSLSSSYESAKLAHNKATNAQDTANQAQAAVEGVDARVTINEGIITNLASQIANLVTDGNGASLMTQTSDGGWTFNMANFDGRLNTTSDELAALLEDVTTMDALVEAIRNTLNDHGATLEYVNIATIDGQPCIELGEGDSDFKLRITNTSIQFIEGSDIPAWITNQALHIKKAVIEEEQQIGGFVWVRRNNGNVGLMWRGGNG